MLKHKYDDVEHDNDDQGDQGNDDHADDRVNCMAWLMMMRVVGLVMERMLVPTRSEVRSRLPRRRRITK